MPSWHPLVFDHFSRTWKSTSSKSPFTQITKKKRKMLTPGPVYGLELPPACPPGRLHFCLLRSPALPLLCPRANKSFNSTTLPALSAFGSYPAFPELWQTSLYRNNVTMYNPQTSRSTVFLGIISSVDISSSENRWQLGSLWWITGVKWMKTNGCWNCI